MGQSPIMLIILVVFGLAFVIYFAMDKKKRNQPSSKVNQDKKNNNNNGYKGTAKELPRKDMSAFMRFDKIANDMIYQKNGEKFTMVIECKGINYELMSEIEQMAVEEGFITFLNTLKFPIQLYVQTRSIDLTENIKVYKARANEFEEKRQEIVTRYNQAESDIDVTPEEISELKEQKLKYTNISEYVSDITRYVERMALNKFLLQRKFYVVISYNKSEVVTTEKFTKEEYEDMCYRELYTRAQGIIGSLFACSVQGRILKSNELAELIYISLNKDDQKALNIKDALDSGFYRLYSTSEDVRLKRQQTLDEEIRKESARRVEQAILEGIEKGTIVFEEEFNETLDKQIDTTAIRIVENSGLNNNVKEEIKDIIMTKRKEKLKKRDEERAKKLEEEKNEQQQVESETIENSQAEIENSVEGIASETSDNGENVIVNDYQEDRIDENTDNENIV